MPYREDLESRRAHVTRLEAELTALEAEETLLLSLPLGQSKPLDRFLGGARELTHEFLVDGELQEVVERLPTLAKEMFGVDGQMNEASGVHFWRGDVEPRPRQVELRVQTSDEGTLVMVSDRRSYRAYQALLGSAAVLLIYTISVNPLAMALGGLAFAGTFVSMRFQTLAITRRRSRELLRLEQEFCSTPPSRIRVEERADQPSGAEQTENEDFQVKAMRKVAS